MRIIYLLLFMLTSFSSLHANTEINEETKPAQKTFFEGDIRIDDFKTQNLYENDVYQGDSIKVLIYRFQFRDAKFEWSIDKINEEMEKVKKYYSEQSYGKFTVTWDTSNPIINISKNAKSTTWHEWLKIYTDEIKKAGVDTKNPGEGVNIMVVTPVAPGNVNSNGGPPLMEIYRRFEAGTVAHELGHTMGLLHANALEAGSKIIGTGNASENKDYGNVYSLMGMGGHTLEAYNLLYKKKFEWVSDAEVPTITKSGTYKIYAFDHGSNTNGNIGIKLKSGNGKHTYWVEYRTTNKRYKDTKNGILVNLQGYIDNTKDTKFWKTISLLVDFRPNSKSGTWPLLDQTDSELVIGKSYTDHWGAFKIQPTAKGGTEDTADAWIEVKVDILK